jgi:hypothetical protein
LYRYFKAAQTTQAKEAAALKAAETDLEAVLAARFAAEVKAEKQAANAAKAKTIATQRKLDEKIAAFEVGLLQVSSVVDPQLDERRLVSTLDRYT